MIAAMTRSKALYSLFLVCFIVYSASPLLFTSGENRDMKGAPAGKIALSENVLHIFLLEFIFSGISPKEGLMSTI